MRQAQGGTTALPAAALIAAAAAVLAFAPAGLAASGLAASGLAASGLAGAGAIAPPAARAPREQAADDKRDEIIADLQRLLPRMEEGPRKADLLFQLAEYQWERARALSLREVAASDAAIARWQAVRDARGAAAAGPEPRVSTRESAAAKAEALAVIRSLLAGQPRYARRDEVLFVLALDLYESGEKDESVRTYQQLLSEHPQSRFVPDAWVQLGEHYFAANDLARARSAFEHAAAGEPAKVYAFALYKLAWCDANAGDLRGAIAKFEQVVAYSQAQARALAGGAQADRIQLASEALKDLVQAFAQADEIDPAVAYFKENDAAHWVESVSRLGAIFFDAGKFELAIRVFRLLEDQVPVHPRAPFWQQKILLACDKLNQRDQVAREMRRLTSAYGPGSPWAKAQAGDDAVLAAGAEPIEEALRALAQDYHQEAVRTKSPATYRLAGEIYQRYLESFPRAGNAGRFRFYLAEVLFALEEWEPAAEQYDLAAAGEPRDGIVRRAAENQILALEKALAARRLASAAASPAAPPEPKDPGEEPIPPLEAKLLRACDRYVAVATPAKDEVAVRYKAALLLYDHGHGTAAAERFAEIIRRWPGDPWAQKAADLSMNLLEARKDWRALSALAQQFHDTARLAPPGSELWRRTAEVAGNARFYFLMELAKTDPASAARELEQFADAQPQGKNAPVALHNAIILAERATELDRVVAAGGRFLRTYPQADATIAKPVLLSLASACERTARFEEAARAQVAFVDRFPHDARAADQLFAAALWTEATGDDDGAIVLWRRYLRAYGSRPEAAKVAFNLGLLHERRKQWPLAVASWSEFLRVHKADVPRGELLVARYKKGLALNALRRAEARAELTLVADGFGALPESEKLPAVADAAAHARFLLAERQFEELVALKLASTRQNVLVSVLKAKNLRLAGLVESYAAVIRVGSPAWSEAALTRLGAAYRDFNKALLEAPAPRGLDAEQQELYRSTLESQALPLEDKAIEAFEKALEIGARLGVYTEWTLRAQELLREYRPDGYGELHRPEWSIGERSWRAEPAVRSGAGQDPGTGTGTGFSDGRSARTKGAP